MGCELRLAWTANDADHLAVRPFGKDAAAKAIDALDGVRAEASFDERVAPAATLNAPCHSNADCGSNGLTCFGPDNHETCQCSSTNLNTYSRVTSKGSGAPACREEGNPAGLFGVVTHFTGCGIALTSDACGHTRTTAAYVTSYWSAAICDQDC